MKIGFYDSGFGGITILKEALKKINNVDFFYLADNLNVPYGNKTKEELIKIVDNNIKIMLLNKCDIIVIACNTATSAAINEMRNKYKNVCIIGTEPAVKLALEYNLSINNNSNKNNINENNKILVTATKHTLQGEKLTNLIKTYNADKLIEKQELSKLVEFAENNNYTKEDVIDYLNEVVKNKEQYSSIVLGCTHFPFFKDEIIDFFNNNIKVFDSSDGVVKNLITKLNEYNKDYKNINRLNNLELYLTKDLKGYKDIFYKLLNK